MELVCPKCGKVGRSSGTIPAGKVVRCPGCKEAFHAPPDSGPGSAGLSIVIDEPSISGEASNIRVKKPAPGLWALVAMTPLVFGGGVFAGRVSAPKAADPTPIPAPAPPPSPFVDRTEDDFNRAINPISTAAIYWSEPEARLRELCVGASTYLVDRKHLIGAGEIAAMLTICGRAECEWRGKEKCTGADLAIGVYAEMLLEGTNSEDAIRILANFHRIRPNGRPDLTAADCDASRKATYNMLKKGKMISVENTLDQFLSIGNLVRGNEGFKYHRQTD